MAIPATNATRGLVGVAVRRIYDINGEITDGASPGFLQGPAARWVDELTAPVLDEGMDTFVLWAGAPRRRQMEMFAQEVAPAVIMTVDAARSRARTEETGSAPGP